MVITDPPFGGNIFYADLSDFFYAWLRRPLSAWYPRIFVASETNKVQEAIVNPAEHPDTRSKDEKRAAKKAGEESTAEQFYREILTECWREGVRVLKDGGILAFTFHHSDPQAWIGLLRSLFDAGLILVATYPIRSDESKGETAAFGSKKIEYDIIHVCRKRLEEPTRVSWAGMRRWVKAEIERLQPLLQHYQEQDLPEADIQVVLRGKALEFYSKHYGQVFSGEGTPVDIRKTVTGINDILDEERVPGANRPPGSADDLTGLYLRIFHDSLEMPSDDVHKLLQGTGHTLDQIIERGWVVEEGRTARIVSVQERFADLQRRPRSTLRTDLDQVHFLIGAAIPGSGVSITDELKRSDFKLVDSVPDILHWLAAREPDQVLRAAAGLAHRLVESFRHPQDEDETKQLTYL